jgi:tRNA-splicing ligase RtcB (3'-phosphate/5'-hydroxy nucleic acid ligase)
MTMFASYKKWGENIEPEAIKQIENACTLPISLRAALMPDAHLGYGLPIGGVLATDNVVIPYAVGVDIACRMRLTIFDRKANIIPGRVDQLVNSIERETRFGIGCEFSKRNDHEVMYRDWSVSPITEQMKDKAWAQLGTSGSGNHFVEFGSLTLTYEQAEALNLPKVSGASVKATEYLALLTHSGSRGTGARVCNHYSKIAKSRFRDGQFTNLEWLPLDSDAGQEYWEAMNLMGLYAAANHELIHKRIARSVGAAVLMTIENHHNFAWKESHIINGVEREVIVHRKGATPAASGVLGIIPGSMATPGFIVRGKGNEDALKSASHGAGRTMGRKAAKQSFTWSDTKKLLADSGVTLISGGLDEMPRAYKDIHTVMAAQTDLVEVLGRFDPKIVKMSGEGKAED